MIDQTAYRRSVDRHLREIFKEPESVQFWALPLKSFSLSLDIVKGRNQEPPDAFAVAAFALMASVAAWNEIDDKRRFWNRWHEEPTTFGEYSRSGDSALHTAALFSATVESAVQVAKVVALGLFDPDRITPQHYGQWHEAFVDELESNAVPTLTEWTMPKLHRDGELLHRKIQQEIRQFDAKPVRQRLVKNVDIARAIVKTGGDPEEDTVDPSTVAKWHDLEWFPDPIKKEGRSKLFDLDAALDAIEANMDYQRKGQF